MQATQAPQASQGIAALMGNPAPMAGPPQAPPPGAAGAPPQGGINNVPPDLKQQLVVAAQLEAQQASQRAMAIQQQLSLPQNPQTQKPLTVVEKMHQQIAQMAQQEEARKQAELAKQVGQGDMVQMQMAQVGMAQQQPPMGPPGNPPQPDPQAQPPQMAARGGLMQARSNIQGFAKGGILGFASDGAVPSGSSWFPEIDPALVDKSTDTTEERAEKHAQRDALANRIQLDKDMKEAARQQAMRQAREDNPPASSQQIVDKFKNTFGIGTQTSNRGREERHSLATPVGLPALAASAAPSPAPSPAAPAADPNAYPTRYSRAADSNAASAPAPDPNGTTPPIDPKQPITGNFTPTDTLWDTASKIPDPTDRANVMALMEQGGLKPAAPAPQSTNTQPDIPSGLTGYIDRVTAEGYPTAQRTEAERYANKMLPAQTFNEQKANIAYLKAQRDQNVNQGEQADPFSRFADFARNVGAHVPRPGENGLAAIGSGMERMNAYNRNAAKERAAATVPIITAQQGVDTGMRADQTKLFDAGQSGYTGALKSAEEAAKSGSQLYGYNSAASASRYGADMGYKASMNQYHLGEQRNDIAQMQAASKELTTEMQVYGRIIEDFSKNQVPTDEAKAAYATAKQRFAEISAFIAQNPKLKGLAGITAPAPASQNQRVSFSSLPK